MKIWSGFALAAVLSFAHQQPAVFAKDICDDAGATPAPTTVAPVPAPSSVVPVPSSVVPVPSSVVPVPTTQSPTPVTQSPSAPPTFAPVPVPTTKSPSPATQSPSTAPTNAPTPGPISTSSSPVTQSPSTTPTAVPVPAPSTVVPTPTVPAPSTAVPVPTPTPTVPAPSTVIPAPTPTTVVPTPTPTPAPTTSAPTPAPTTTVPVTPSPTTPVPVTSSPTTPVPTTTIPTPTPVPGVGCGAQLKQIYYHGFDLEELPLKTPEECCAACNANPKCKLYTHFYSKTTGVLRCMLKSAPGEKTNYGDSQSVVVVSAFANETPSPTTAPTSAPTPAPTAAPAPTCGTQLKQIYFHGHDISEFTLNTPEECCTECGREPKCVLYTYFYSKTTGVKRCLLKSAAGEKTNYGDSKSVVAVSAYVTRPTPVPTPTPSVPPTPEPTPAPAPTCGPQLKQIYFHGEIISEFIFETPEECCTECGRDPKCIVYTYFYSKTTGRKRCLVMSSAGEKTNYGDSQSVVAVSAYVTHPTPAPTPSSAPTPAPVCTIANGEYCGNSQGTLCCDSTSYCQPWNNDYYQCIGLPTGCGDLETDVDYYGGDIKHVSNVFPWDCCRLCQETDGCSVYTFVNLDPSGPTCYLKNSGAGRVYKTGALSGRRTNFSPLPTPTTAPTPEPTPEPVTPSPTTPVPAPSTNSTSNCGQVLKNIYIHGEDIKQLTLEQPEACCDECAKTPGCLLYTHFASSTTGQRVCRLMSASGEKTNYADSRTVTASSAFVNVPLPWPTVVP